MTLRPEHVAIVKDALEYADEGFRRMWTCECGKENPVISEVCFGCGVEPMPPHPDVVAYYAHLFDEDL